jgi:hypothetical protein
MQMRELPFGTQISPQQIRLRSLFSVQRILAARGFTVVSEGSFRDTLLARDRWSREEFQLAFEIFSNSEWRQELLKAVENPICAPTGTQLGKFVSLPDFQPERQRYSKMFEWFVGELLVQEFMAFSSSFSVTVEGVLRNSDGGTSGDYDVLSVLGDMNLLYLECKTGKCKRQSILNSVERSIALHSVGCVLLLDSPLDLSSLRQQLSGVQHPRFRSPGSLARIAVRGFPNSDVAQWFDCYFVGAGELSGDIETKLRTVMRILAAKRSSVFEELEPSPNEYAAMGYEFSEQAL